MSLNYTPWLMSLNYTPWLMSLNYTPWLMSLNYTPWLMSLNYTPWLMSLKNRSSACETSHNLKLFFTDSFRMCCTDVLMPCV